MTAIDRVAGIAVPDSALARDITQLVRDTESDLLYHHSRRVWFFAALTGEAKALKYDPELLYAAAMFHDMGLVPAHASTDKRFEVDGANVARAFLRSRGVAEADIETVWTSIALHTTPGIPPFMRPEIALLTAGVEMDVLGLGFDTVSEADRETVAVAHPRGPAFKQGIVDAFYQGVRNKPETTFGNVKADVIAYKDPHFQRGDFVQCILHNHWPT
ncbi:HD domain-containing protein [Luteibacter sp. UNCMF331Sha3.1]|uniref:HD domain-containing protein n=1 Tax=Luteibacter sp. UNCMF331Sha3.1 TaxID=1502760 RepID=UPI0008B5364B|nr:HD domain-containing protein [Luteibacter sp. UNCMF331Sha3.1]SEM58535.1 HD domain-containing protein [Luteibacter sp. UNCMF331Sha3.1]